MATTPNYGWVTPAPTDFVTDLPADFETFADAVDADLAGLLGGTTGQVLAKDSNADHDFSWTTIGGGGKVLQVVQAISTTITSNTTSTYADTNLSATITPSANTSKILVLVNQRLRIFRSDAEQYLDLQILRDATVIEENTRIMEFNGTGVTAIDMGLKLDLVYLDSPATTSATTYKTQFKAGLTSNSGSVQAQSASRPSSITLLEIGA